MSNKLESKDSKTWDLLAIGAVAVDDFLYLDHFPEPDTKAQILGRERQGGGLAGTALVAAARQGASAAYCGRLGEDELSKFTIAGLEKEGIDCSPVYLDVDACPIYSTVLVEQPTGQRTILFDRRGFKEPSPEQVTPNLVRSAKMLFIDHTVIGAAIPAAHLAHSLGVPVIADLEKDEDPRIRTLLELVDHLVIGTEFGRQVTGLWDPADITTALNAPERACIVVTAGSQGCWYASSGGPVQHVPAFCVDAIDTTGCGDVFHGVYAAWLIHGAGIDLAIQAASAAAALKATCRGGQMGIPNRQRVEQFLKDHTCAG
ncbi:MAG TPA: PfkB family carbohydrate kinase [Anaerolineaceae bacterium]